MDLTTQQRIALIESVKRCTARPEFTAQFYERFLAADPAIPAYFANTDFAKQQRMLAHSLSLMVRAGVRGNTLSRELIEVADGHGVQGMNIPAHMYDAWVGALVYAAGRVDPEFSVDLMVAWRTFFTAQVALFVAHAKPS